MSMGKKAIIFGLLLFFVSLAQPTVAQISNLKVPATVRLNETITIAGTYTAADELCKFVILDSNGFAVERLSDEFTFADNTFYSQRQITEPPYYRGDDYNVVVTCGSHQGSSLFRLDQPVSLAHGITKTFEYGFQENNMDAIMLFISFLSIPIVGILGIVWFKKVGERYAS